MNRFLTLLIASILFACPVRAAKAQEPEKVSFAWLSDIHFNSFAYAEDDLRQALEEINQMDSIRFVIISGDLAEFGATDEFSRLQKILDRCRKPYYLVTGNHDVNWSENGCTAYETFFGPPHFVLDVAGVRLVGCGAGPMLRMGAPCIPKEEITWLRQVIDTTDARIPLLFVNHFPMDPGVTNSTDIISLLKQKNIQAILCGHEHRNASRHFNGVENIIGRSLLRRKDPIGGYNIVTLCRDSLQVAERIIKDKTRPAWHRIVFHQPKDYPDTARYEVSYAANQKYPQIKKVWSRVEPSDIASQGTVDGSLYVYTTTTGKVCAIDAETGDEYWSYQTGNKIFSAPFITKKLVYISSCDGTIYALRRNNGTPVWKYHTGYPVVACPVVKNEVLYIGSSNGKFYALRAATGEPVWIAEGIKGYIESRPAVDKKNVYTGTWGAMFYALDKKTGRKKWEFDTGKGRYFSPGACWPQVAGNRVFIQSSDYAMRAFDPDGHIAWQTSEPKGREAIGFSPGLKTLYIQGIGNNITAYQISRKNIVQKWVTEMPYESNFIPTRLLVLKKQILVPSAFGVIYAIDRGGSGVQWEYKISHSAITSFAPAPGGDVIVMTMDGQITRLAIPKK